tara:strand:- start:1266 stop:4178 length:2913 start_codon:yes stop_codon:yes gene_type:complete
MDDINSSDLFQRRHLGLSEKDEKKMLNKLGFNEIEEFINQVIPKDIQLNNESISDFPVGCSETEALQKIEDIANQNQYKRSLIGLGYYGTHTPEVIKRHVLENPRWYTSYTPYQAEISQGRLEALFNFQSLICELTGFPIANASLLDEGTAAAEAMSVSYAARKNKSSNVFLVHESVYNQTFNVLQTRARPLNILLKTFTNKTCNIDPSVFGVLIQLPGQNGELFNPSFLVSKAHKLDIIVCASVDPLAQILIKPVADFGIDIAIGSMQRFGVPVGFGGPHAAFFACSDKFRRLIPGRIVGETISKDGEKSLRLALQTREQHIRREKATSNICTSQSLLAIISSFYAIYHGYKGLSAIAKRVVILRRHLELCLHELGFELNQGIRFDSFDIYSTKSVEIHKSAIANGFNFRILPLGADIDHAKGFGISLDELSDINEINKILNIIADVVGKKINFEKITIQNVFKLDGIPLRKEKLLQQNVFKNYRSETDLMRYIFSLAEKDFSLVDGMIPLGSCTMKLNAAAELKPISWKNFSTLHPYAPKSQTKGFQKIISDLEKWISEIVGLDAVSFQPNAGSQGEFAGLLAIRSFFLSKNDVNRKKCLIPKSAHGTNPASAVMAGFDVVQIDCDNYGNIDFDDLSNKVNNLGSQIGALMLTYPSTHGVFETNIRKICDLIHSIGGFVYLDGANLNAQVGLCKPGLYGVDVCHLNLHKTFCIPHGGGGPGVGPIAVSSKLKSFVPTHTLSKQIYPNQSKFSISSSMYGSASILPISWMYIQMIGYQGLKHASSNAILSANYIAFSLKDKFKILYKGENDFVAHECILDFRYLKQKVGLNVNDIAKRLIDYSFHAPTISWPVPETMMIEPTESESLKEIERFCSAMLSISEEISEIEKNIYPQDNNVMVNAPHTLKHLIIHDWDKPYSKEKAAYPFKNKTHVKFWSSVSRINNAYGDKNLICSCSFPIADAIEEKKCA